MINFIKMWYLMILFIDHGKKPRKVWIRSLAAACRLK